MVVSICIIDTLFKIPLKLSMRQQSVMKSERRVFTILMAEDDEDDRLLTDEAFKLAGLNGKLDFVKYGNELIAYLTQSAKTPPNSTPRPSIILLDLNMPRKDGREVLRELKAHPTWKRIPIIVLTTSSDQEDIDLAYELGANSFVCKPS